MNKIGLLSLTRNGLHGTILCTDTASLAGLRVNFIGKQTAALLCGTAFIEYVLLILLPEIADCGEDRICCRTAESTE